jgi:hypothetical protein
MPGLGRHCRVLWLEHGECGAKWLGTKGTVPKKHKFLQFRPAFAISSSVSLRRRLTWHNGKRITVSGAFDPGAENPKLVCFQVSLSTGEVHRGRASSRPNKSIVGQMS